MSPLPLWTGPILYVVCLCLWHLSGVHCVWCCVFGIQWTRILLWNIVFLFSAIIDICMENYWKWIEVSCKLQIWIKFHVGATLEYTLCMMHYSVDTYTQYTTYFVVTFFICFLNIPAHCWHIFWILIFVFLNAFFYHVHMGILKGVFGFVVVSRS